MPGKFRFSLQSALEYRVSCRDTAQGVLAKAQTEWLKRRENLRLLREELEKSIRARPADPGLLRSYLDWIEHLKRRIAVAEQEVAHQEKDVQRARAQLTERIRELRVLEILKERQLADFKKEQRKKEQKFSDEIASFPRGILMVFFLFCLLHLPARAGSHSAIPSADFGGTAADSFQIQPNFSTGILIAVDTNLFLPAMDTAINLAFVNPNALERFGSTPLISAGDHGVFKVMFLWYFREATKPSNVEPYYNFHLIASVRPADKTIQLLDTAGFSNFSNASNLYRYFYGGGTSTQKYSVPVFTDFYASSSSWIAQWSNDSNTLGPAARSTSWQSWPTGYANQTHFIRWPCGPPPIALGGCPRDTLQGGGPVVPRNFLRMAMAPLGSSLDTIVAVHGPSRSMGASPTWNYVAVRWERLSIPYLFAMDSIALPAYSGLYHVAAVGDPNQRVLVAYTGSSGQVLNLRAYDNDFVNGSPTLLAQAVFPVNIDIGSERADTMSRNFSLAALGDRLFAVTYARSSIIYLRTVDLSGGTLSVGPEWRVSPSASNRMPEIAVNNRYLTIAYLRDGPGGLRPEIVRFKRLGLSGLDPDTVLRTYGGPTMTFSTVINNVQPNNTQMARDLHLATRPSVAVDTAGSVVLGFHQERNARLAAFRTRALYKNTGWWRSRAINLVAPGVSLTLMPGDSVRFLSTQIYGVSTANSVLSLERNGTDIAAAGSGQYEANAAFRYRISLTRPDSFNTPRVDSVRITWNLQPRKPDILSIRVGDSPEEPFDSAELYTVVNRRDSVILTVQAQDLDNPESLTLRIRTVTVAPLRGTPQSFQLSQDLTLTRQSNGIYSGTLKIAPQNLVADSLILHLSADDGSWISRPLRLRLRYRNSTPLYSLRLRWLNGLSQVLDSNITCARSFRVQMNDSAQISVWIADSNDHQVTARWNIRDASGSLKLDSAIVSVPDTTRLRIPLDDLDRNPFRLVRADSLELNPDSLYLTIRDPDTNLVCSLVFIPNHHPVLDSISAISYEHQGVRRDTLIGRWKRGDDPAYLSVVPGVPVRLISHGRDVDAVNGDRFVREWIVLLQDPHNKTQWYVDHRTYSDTLQYTFPANPLNQLAMLAIAQSDLTGAVSSDTLRIVFPRVDTLGSWSLTLNYLQDSLRFILGSARTRASGRVELRNIGSVSLDISAIRTGKNDGPWLDYLIERPGFSAIQDNTHVNALPAPIRLSPGESLPITLFFDVSAMSGDRQESDTLYIFTNDFLTPQVQVPFRIRWDDLPRVRVFTRAPGKQTLEPLAPYFPVNRSLVFVFSEPVQRDSVRFALRIYSRLDSIARNAPGITDMESAYPQQYLFRSSSPRSGLADTVIFTPYYRSPSDYFNTVPPPYSFLRADQIGIYIRNSITDSNGNPLDLRENRAPIPPGSLDTVLLALTDTSSLQVLRTWPAHLDTLHADEEIRVLFSKPLSPYAVFGSDSVRTLDLTELRGDSNTTIRLRSRFSQNLLMDFRSLRLERGDSLLVIRPRYKFLSQDCVSVWLSPAISSAQGHTLDGNGDRITRWPVDSADAYTFLFIVGASRFYVFPNPYKANNPEHRQKGSITFKNLHQIPGIDLTQEMDIRIHTLSGTLVYSTERQKNDLRFNSEENRPPQFDWPLINNHGHPVASGVYLFSIAQKGKVLYKSKLMVIR